MILCVFTEARLKAEQEEKERLEREKKLAEEKRIRETKVSLPDPCLS